jgi:hypothetical protein
VECSVEILGEKRELALGERFLQPLPLPFLVAHQVNQDIRVKHCLPVLGGRRESEWVVVFVLLVVVAIFVAARPGAFDCTWGVVGKWGKSARR